MNLFTYVCPKESLSKGAEKFLFDRLNIIVDLNSKDYVEIINDYRIVKMRSWDVPQITEIIGNYGITGYDIFLDYKIRYSKSKLQKIEDLDFGNATVYILGKKSLDEYEQPINVGTPFVGLSKKFFQDLGYKVIINKVLLEKVGGSWEALVDLGLADVIVDVVNEGKTSGANKLKKLAKVLDSNAILIEKVN